MAQVGYCQGMSYLAHLILERIQDEATSFWMFVTLMERYGMKSFYLPDLRRLKVVCYQLDRLTKQHLPELHEHLEMLMVPNTTLPGLESGAAPFPALPTSPTALSTHATLGRYAPSPQQI